MDLAKRLSSFPFIAAAALLLASLFGVAVGFATSITPSGAVVVGDFDEAGSARGKSGDPLAGGSKQRRPLAGDTGKSRDNKGTDTVKSTNGGGTTDTPPVTGNGSGPAPIRDPGKARTLPEGRTDEMQLIELQAEPDCSIDVTVSDSRGNRLPLSQIGLDVSAGPLGWHAVPKQPQQVAGERGVFRYAQLYPGEYRVRSLAANYKSTEQVVRLAHSGAAESVNLILEPLDYAQIEFFVKYEDGEVPDEVELRIRRGAHEDTSIPGRFGEHPEATATATRAGVIPPTRYRQKTQAGGMISLTLPVGQTAEIGFGAVRDNQQFSAEASVSPTPGRSQQEVILRPTDEVSDSGRVATLTNLTVGLTVKGQAGTFTRVNLYKSINDFQFRAPSKIEGGRYTWENLFSGTWFLVVEASGFHAPYVQQIEVLSDTSLDVDILTGHLRVMAIREQGSPDPSGDARYRVHLRPMGSGTVERSYSGNLTGKQLDHIDFFVPFGQYDVRVESPENSPKLSVQPEERSVQINTTQETRLEFTVGAAATLKFTCVTSAGTPIPNAEYLISFHPAGAVPETDKVKVRKGTYDGVCETEIAPAGPVYVHIWTTSTDWNNPDKVFQIDLPAYGIKDLGAVVIEP